MARLRVLGENPPPPRGNGENQLRELRDYLTRLKDELEFLLTHLGEDNLDQNLTEYIRQLGRLQGQADDATAWLQRMAGRNLLRNWYFAGAAAFPVNTRGQTNYTGGYACDGWYGRGSLPISLTPSGMQITAAAGTLRGLSQSVDSREALIGKTVTASILLSGYSFTRDEAGYPKLGLYGGNRVYLWTYPVFEESVPGSGLFSVTGQVTEDIMDYDKLNFALHLNTSGGSATIIAAKLELGEEQTLAHQENGEWVLNEIPNYEEELIRCMTSVANAGTGTYDDPYSGKVIAFE